MIVAFANNLPELLLGTCWTIVAFWLGRRWERWRGAHHLFPNKRKLEL